MGLQSRVWVDIRNPYGVRVPTLNGEMIDGPAIGAVVTSYHADGCVLDKIGTIAFKIPMTKRRNLAISVGDQIVVIEAETGIEMAHGVVTATAETVSQDGHWAEFTCPDLLHELTFTGTGSGMVWGLNDTFAGIIGGLVGKHNRVVTADGHPEATWGAVSDVTNANGIPFDSQFQTIAEAVSTICKTAKAHLRRDTGRVLRVSRFDAGAKAAIRLVQAGRLPNKAAENADIRQIISLTRQIDGAVINDIVAVGNGDGVAQLTMMDLYSSSDFHNDVIPGYDPQHPIRKRARDDNGGIDGQEYYIDDGVSIAAYRRHQGSVVRSDIAPIGGTTTDLLYAEAELYSAAVAALKWLKDPHETLAVVTEGRGDIRNLAGLLMHVAYTEVNDEGIVTLQINNDYYVMEIVRSWSDTGAAQDAWTLSSVGQYKQDGLQVIVGALAKIDNLAVTPAVYPVTENIWLETHIAAGNGVAVPIDSNLGCVRLVEAKFSVSLLGALSTVQTVAGGAHSHSVVIPSQSWNDISLGHPHAPTSSSQGNHGHTPTSSDQGAHTGTGAGGQFAHNHGSSSPASKSGTSDNTGGFTFDHNHTLPVTQGGDPVVANVGGNHAGILYINAGNQGNVTSIQASFASGALAVGFARNDTSHGHSDTISVGGGGNVSGANQAFTPNAGGSGGFGPSVNGYGGFGPTVNSYGGGSTPNGTGATTSTTVQSSSDGAHNHSLVYGYFRNDAAVPSGVTVVINGVVVAGPFFTNFTVDLAPWIPVTGGVTITFTSNTFGRIQIRGRLRRHETTVLAKT